MTIAEVIGQAWKA